MQEHVDNVQQEKKASDRAEDDTGDDTGSEGVIGALVGYWHSGEGAARVVVLADREGIVP